MKLATLAIAAALALCLVPAAASAEMATAAYLSWACRSEWAAGEVQDARAGLGWTYAVSRARELGCDRIEPGTPLEVAMGSGEGYPLLPVMVGINGKIRWISPLNALGVVWVRCHMPWGSTGVNDVCPNRGR